MRVQCPNCSKVFPVTAKVAGRKAKCGCGTVLQMPQLKSEAASPASTQKIEMACESCNRRLSVPASAAGKLVKCPCGAKARKCPACWICSASANDPFAMPTESFGNDPFGSDSFSNDS